MRRRTRSTSSWIGLALLALLWGGGVALAHPKIRAIDPQPGAQLDRPPARLRISWDEPLEALSRLELRDSAGRLVRGGGAPLQADPTALALDLPTLGPGIYTMIWTVVGSDGHVVQGNAAFSVAGGAASAAGPTAAASVTPLAPPPVTAAPAAGAALAALLRGLMLVGVAWGVGGLAFLGAVAGPARAHLGDSRALERGRRWLAAPLASAALAAALMWAAQAQAALGRFDADGLAQVAGTRYGELLLARAGLALALAALALRWRRAGPVALRGGLAALLAAGLLLSFALGGHPAAAPAPLLPVLADAIHMAAATLWGGGLLAFATLLPGLLRAAPAERRAALLRAIFARFSGLALACAALLAISGTYATLRELGAPADLWRTAYGLALLVKLAAFGGMLLLGAYHLLAARPALNAWADGVAQAAVDLPGRLGRSLRAEAGLALLALLAAGALTSLAPPADAGSAADLWAQPTPTAIRVPTATPGPTRTPAPSRPFAATEAAGDLLVRLTIAPASIGQNRFQVLVSDAAGRPAATQLVRLTFTMLEMDMGTNTLEAAPAGAGGYAAAGSPLSMVGDWQVTVTVRRAGLRDVAAVFRVPVGE